MERVVIQVPAAIADALRTLAWREDRDPQRQAERILREGLIQAGVLPDLRPAAVSEPASAAS